MLFIYFIQFVDNEINNVYLLTVRRKNVQPADALIKVLQAIGGYSER